MFCYGARELATAFRTVRKNTIQVAEDIPENKYDHRPAEGARTVRQMFVHVALAPTTLWLPMHGTRAADVTAFDFGGVSRKMASEEAAGRSKAEVIELLTDQGEAFATFLESWSDQELAQPVLTFASGGKVEKPRLELLMSAKEHEMHHRAQLMLIERQLGIIPHATRRMQEYLAKLAADSKQ